MNQSFVEEIYSGLSKDRINTLRKLFNQRLDSLNLSERQLEAILKIDRKTIKNIINGETKKVDVHNLIKIGSFIGMSFSDTLKLFVSEMSREEISELERTRRLTYIAENFDLKGLKKMGFISSTSNFEEIEQKLVSFFEIPDVFSYTKEIGMAFSRAKKNYNNKMLDFWNKSAYAFFEKVDNPNPYDRERLIEVIPNIKPYSQDVANGLRVISKALFGMGITLIFQPYLPTTQVRGATFVVNGKPCIVITNRNKNYATLWFALLHELYHVLFELEKVEKSVFHLTGELNLEFVDEAAANNFARQYFLSTEKSRYIFPFIDDEVIIKRYASKNNIHPSLIYNFYCYDQKINNSKDYWGIYKRHMPSTELATRNLNSDIWNSNNITEGVLKSINVNISK